MGSADSGECTRSSPAAMVRAWPSLSLLFALPSVVGGDEARAADSDDASCREPERQLSWRVAAYRDTKTGVYGGPFVEDTFQALGFGPPVYNDDWDLLWTHYPQNKALQSVELPPRRPRLVNHAGYFTAAGQKCRFAGHLKRVEATLRGHARPPDGTVEAAPGGRRKPRHLRTFQLVNRSEHEAWRRAMREDPRQYWVLKSCAGAASQNVTIVSVEDEAAAAAVSGKWYVAQEYMHRAMTSDGERKFHARLYVFVPRWSPVGVLLYTDGIIFRSRHRHDSDRPSQARDVFSSISSDVEPLSIAHLWDELGAEKSSKARANLREVLAEVFGTALEASFGDASALDARGYVGFDLFGVDLMFDNELWPYILEVNMGPNLWVDRQGEVGEVLLRAVKEPLVKQLAAWASARIHLGRRETPVSVEALLELEASALPSFVRIL